LRARYDPLTKARGRSWARRSGGAPVASLDTSGAQPTDLTASSMPRRTLIRWYAPVMAGLGVAILGWALFELLAAYIAVGNDGRVGGDLALYLDVTRRWLAGGDFYPNHQVAGQYVIAFGDVLYPPTTIPLFVAFLALPAPLFVALPLAIVAWIVVDYRPAPWTWPLMAACFAFPQTMLKFVYLNPVVWTASAVALGTRYGWPGALVLLKPSVAPFALIGISRRSWWAVIVAFALVALALAPMWPDYLRVMLNSRNEAGLLYSLSDVPLLLVPLIAWAGRDRGPAPAPWSPVGRGTCDDKSDVSGMTGRQDGPIDATVRPPRR
jgi:hypothetical protein